jgi:hypothetical protein
MQQVDEKSAEERFTEAMNNALGELNQGRLAAWEEMRTLHVLDTALMLREKRRLERKLGPQHPLVGKLEEGIARGAELARSLRAQLEVAKILVPQVTEGGALVHGRVTDENGRGIVGAVVGYEPTEGKGSLSLGPVETDQFGYFAIQVAADRLEALNAADHMLVARSKAGRLLHRERDPLEITAGAKLVKQVVLDRRTLWGPAALHGKG